MTLVVDASVALAASAVPEGFADLRDRDLLAPPLMWLHVDDLPLAAPVSSPSPSIGRDAAR